MCKLGSYEILHFAKNMLLMAQSQLEVENPLQDTN